MDNFNWYYPPIIPRASSFQDVGRGRPYDNPWTEPEERIFPGFMRYGPQNHPPSAPPMNPPPLQELRRRRGNNPYWLASLEPIMIGAFNFMGAQLSPLEMEVLILNSVARESALQASSSSHEGSRLTEDEQNKAVKKLKKEMYNPMPKRLSSRLCLYYRDKAAQTAKEIAKEKEEDGKRCAVCLEDFEAREMVMITPCNHLFHEDCIVPWVKSQGHCPVCRFSLCDNTTGTGSSSTSY